MGKKIMDRRARKTRNDLKVALTNLLVKKNIKEISVKELTDLADLNRGTFYLHYRDIYDLYEQLQNEIYDELRLIFGKHLNSNRQTALPLVVSEIFEFLSKKKELTLVILSSQDSDLLSRIIELGKPKSEGEWHSLLGEVNPELYEYHYTFITSGCVGLILSWLTGGMIEPPAKMAELAGMMILRAYNS